MTKTSARKTQHQHQPIWRQKKPLAPLTAVLPLTTSAVRDDLTSLGYKVRVLIYDLLNCAKDPSSNARLNATTDEHHISEPYFQKRESDLVKAALVDVQFFDNLEPTEPEAATSLMPNLRDRPFEEALCFLLRNFLVKRKASGDSRPCGPHDLAPIYAALFGLDISEIREGGFLNRLQREGV